MFLKRIELQGFKSFADKTIIAFEDEVTGIVGPNGCGKSNVNDAIRWVLGEQSAKSLRGGSMSDVIFSGSQSRKAVNMAEVTLVFDNSKKNLDIEFEEVEVTRRLYRNSGDAEYLINKTPCRLKDIINMIMDSGLGRDSLSVISQGNISEFVSSKPIDRRGLFEEAAGVAKYKKRKVESLSKLNRTQENLLRLEDINEELEARVNPLRRQAKKAEKYISMKEELETIEINVIVDEVQTFSDEIEKLKNVAFEHESSRAIAETSIAVEEQKIDEAKRTMSELDKEVYKLQSDFTNISNEITTLNSRKSELDEKRRYTLESANNAERVKELKNMLVEAEYEYNDRLKRLNDLKTSHSLAKDNFQKVSQKFNEYSENNSKLSSYINKLNNRKEVLDNLSKSPFIHQAGVKTIMDAKDSLYGIHGVTSQLLKPVENYEVAISNALGNAIYHIVSEDADSARHAITYLKKNQGGRATFLPLNVLKEHYINENDEIVANNCNGYLGVACDFVEYEDQYEIIAASLLGNVLICDKLINANELAKLLKYRYKIITLDGDVVHKGGSMSGGKIKDSYSPLTISSELKNITIKIDEQTTLYNDNKVKINELSNKLSSYRDDEVELNLAMAKLEPLVEIKKTKFDKLKDEYNELNPDDIFNENDENVVSDLAVHLSEVNSKKDDIENDLNNKREKRFKLGRDVEARDAKIKETRRDLNILNNIEKENEIKLAKLETNLDNTLARLATNYEMTYEHAKSIVQDSEVVENAREEVLRLRNEIAKLGNVNLDAPEEFKSVNERYELLTTQISDLNEAKSKILNAIDEMDEVMSTQFSEMFNKINSELDSTFKALFGGGKAMLYLEDPNDILNSGIEINVQPPGKNIVNMNGLSGGEVALVAMAVLFAILKARTIPLCIFDEVEAALDQANVERFAKYVGTFKGDSQFIIVTHRPGTMAQCDSLFGVTMQQDGVSKILKVKLNDALNYVDDGNKSEVNS